MLAGRRSFKSTKLLPSRGGAAGAELALGGDALRLSASGSWTIREVARLERTLEQLEMPSLPDAGIHGEFDLTNLAHLDTAGAWLLARTADLWSGLGMAPQFTGVSETHAILLDEIRAHRPSADTLDFVRPAPESIVTDIGRAAVQIGPFTYALIAFLGAVTASIAATVVRPWRFRGTAFVHHLEHAGLRALPIVALICLLIGAVIMQQGAVQLRYYGAEPFAVNLLAVLSLREVAVLLTAIMVAGRSASAFAAEIGSMKMREEIDAMRTLGIKPLETLVVPRVLALMIALPLLTFVAGIMCLLGGGIVAVLMLDMDPVSYLARLHGTIEMRHVLVGLVKTPFAALSIALIGCLEGLKVQGSAESLGHHVTSAVVKAIFVVIILDAVFALFLSAVGI